MTVTSPYFKSHSCLAVKDRCLVVASPTDAGPESEVTLVAFVNPEKQLAGIPAVSWPIIGICVVPLEKGYRVVNVGNYGDIQIFEPASEPVKVQEVQLPLNPALPLRARGAKFIDGSLYVVGMERQVFVSDASGLAWTGLNQGLERDPKEAISGFDAIAGGDGKLWAVGVNGVIYIHEDSHWSPLASPSKLWLHAIVRVHSTLFYIAGKSGTLLQGDGRHFTPIDNGFGHDVFRSLAWFKETLYIGGQSGIYRLAGNQVELLPISQELHGGMLSAGDDRLWLTSGPYIFSTTDGTKWDQVVFEEKQK